MLSRFLVVAALVSTPFAIQSQSPKDTEAIKAIVADMQTAWNQGDDEAFSAHYASDGTFTNILGDQLYGKAGFQKQHHMIFTTIYKGSTVRFTPGRLHFIEPNVALLDVDTNLSHVQRFPPGTYVFPDGSAHTKLLVVLTKEADGWQISAFHNVAVTPHPAGGPDSNH